MDHSQYDDTNTNNEDDSENKNEVLEPGTGPCRVRRRTRKSPRFSEPSRGHVDSDVHGRASADLPPSLPPQNSTGDMLTVTSNPSTSYEVMPCKARYSKELAIRILLHSLRILSLI